MAARQLDALLAAAGIDPADGVQVASADRLAGIPFDPALPLIVLAAPDRATTSESAVLPGRHARRTPLELLRALYPPRHALRRPLAERRAAALGWADPPAWRRATGWCPRWRRSTTWPACMAWPPSPPACAPPTAARGIGARRTPPASFVLEEAYEMVDAIEQGSSSDLAEDLATSSCR